MHYKNNTILFFLLFLPNLCAAKNHVVALNILELEKTFTIKPSLNFKTSKHIKEAIDNGTRIQVIAKAQLFEKKNWWFDSDISNKKIYLEISYFTLSKLYVVKNKDTGEQLGFNDYQQMWKEFEKLMVFEFEQQASINTWVQLRVVLDQGALPTVMQLPVLIDENWDIDTGWFQQKVNLK